MTDNFVDAWVGPKNSRVYEDQNGDLIIKENGSRSWRNNNPGNIIKLDYTNRKGAIGGDDKFAIFPNYEIGQKAKHDLLKGKKYQNLTIEKAIYEYAPPIENNTEAYIKAIKDYAGLDRNIPMSSLSSEQMESLQQAIKKIEVFKSGTERKVFRESLEYRELKKWEKTDPVWALGQSLENLDEQDIRDIMNSQEYLKNPQTEDEIYIRNRVHKIVRQWHEKHYSTKAETDATGRAVWPEEPKTPALKKQPQSPVRPKSPGSVRVRPYDRESGREHVKAHTRALPQRNSKSAKGK